jgi:glycosyltransferase involved in cell wall biosynthesis
VNNLDPLVSIVVPCYNQADYLKQAIDSVLSQDYPRIELIILDDGSTDDTQAVLAAYAGRFNFESHANMGQAGTLNKGWGMSKGEILSYLAADDFLLPGAVRTSVEKLIADPGIVLTYCDFNLVDSQSGVLRRKRAPGFSYRDLAVRIICQPGPGVFFRRDAFQRAGFWDVFLKQIPDYEYWLRLGLVGKFERIPEVLAAYRVHDQSYSFSPVNGSRAEEIVNVISAHFRNGRLPPEIAQARPEAMSNAHIVSARLHLRSGRYAAALKHVGAAFGLHPYGFLRLRTWWLIASGLFNRIGYKAYGQFKRIFSGG